MTYYLYLSRAIAALVIAAPIPDIEPNVAYKSQYAPPPIGD